MKLLTKETKIGMTAVAAIVLLYLLINFLKGVNVFKASNTYYVEFENIQGLTVSNAVYANGYPVGIVRTIEYDYNRKNRVIVGVELDKEMQVPEGTRAELESSLMGGVSMHLILGPNPTRHIARGDTLRGGLHQGAMAQAEQLIPVIVEMAPKLDSIVTNLNTLTGDAALVQMIHNFANVSANLSQASACLNAQLPMMLEQFGQASKNINRMTGNLAGVDVKQTMNEVNATLNSAQQSLAEVQKFSQNLNRMSADLTQKLNGRDNSLGLLMNDRALYDNLNTTVSNLNHTVQSGDSLLIDLKAHPKRYVHFSIFGKKDK